MVQFFFWFAQHGIISRVKTGLWQLRSNGAKYAFLDALRRFVADRGDRFTVFYEKTGIADDIFL